jgi:nucleoside phosphorylase
MHEIGKADVAILTVIPAELRAALATFTIPEAQRKKDEFGTVYHYGQIVSHRSRRSYSVVVGCIGATGNPSAAAAAAEFIQSHQPKAFFLLGIAAGIRGKVKIGEVVFSDRVIAYEPAALVRHEERTVVEPRPEIDRIPHAMNQDLVAYAPDLERIAKRAQASGVRLPESTPGQEDVFQQHVASKAAARVATIASGEKLLRDPAKLHAIRAELHGRVEAGEMEAAGVVAACSRRGIPWLIVRGISDFGDEFKNDAFHDYAAGMAAAVLADFISHGLELDPAPQRPSSPPLMVSFTQVGWPHVDFSIINTTSHPIQITSIRARRLSMMDCEHWVALQSRIEHDRMAVHAVAPRFPLEVNLNHRFQEFHVTTLFGDAQVANLGPGEAEAFRLEFRAKESVALLALEIECLSANAPHQSVLQWPTILAVHGATYLNDQPPQVEGAVSALSCLEAMECLLQAHPPGLWKERPFVDCDWQKLFARAAGHLSKHDPGGCFDRLREVYGSDALWGSILVSFAEVYEPADRRVWDRLEAWSRNPRLRAVDHFRAFRSASHRTAGLIIDLFLASRKGAEIPWLFAFIDATIALAELDGLQHEFSRGIRELQSIAINCLIRLITDQKHNTRRISGTSDQVDSFHEPKPTLSVWPPPTGESLHTVSGGLASGLTPSQREGIVEYLIALRTAVPQLDFDNSLMGYIRSYLDSSWFSSPKWDKIRQWLQSSIWWKQTDSHRIPQHLLAWWRDKRSHAEAPAFDWRRHSHRLSQFWDVLLHEITELDCGGLLQSSEPLVRCAIAMRADLPASTAHSLAQDPSPYIRCLLAGNPDTSPAILELLARDPHRQVCAYAQDQLRRRSVR